MKSNIATYPIITRFSSPRTHWREKMYLWLREAVNLCSYDCARLRSSCEMGVLSPSSFQRSTPSSLSRLGPGAGFMSTLVKIHWTRSFLQPLKPASFILASWGSTKNSICGGNIKKANRPWKMKKCLILWFWLDNWFLIIKIKDKVGWRGGHAFNPSTWEVKAGGFLWVPRDSVKKKKQQK